MNSKILESTTDVVIVIDKTSTIIDVNSSIEDVFLYKKAEVIGEKLEMLLPERYRDGHRKMMIGYAMNPTPRRMGSGRSLTACDKFGREFDVDVALSFYESEDKIYYTAIIRDITDIKETERSLQKGNKDLLAQNRELEHFAYMVSHDLKAPTRGIIELINVLKEDHLPELSADVLEYMDLIQNGALKMAELIDGILSYSRASRTVDEFSEFTLSKILKDVIETLPKREGIKFILPQDKVNLTSNKIQLMQVLSNLIGNAIKYHHNPQEGVIEINFKNTIELYEFSIKDNGPGIAPKYHSKIFEMFETAHETDRADSTGIGLAIVKKIIERNGGMIEMTSELGKGSEFTFSWKKPRKLL